MKKKQPYLPAEITVVPVSVKNILTISAEESGTDVRIPWNL